MDYFLKASALMVIFYVCYIIFLQRETFFDSNRWFLIVGLVTAVLLPMLVIPIYVEVTPMSLDGLTMIDTTAQNVLEVFDINTLLIWVYGIGASLFLGRLTIHLISLVTLIKKNGKKKIGQYTYVETSQSTTPFSFFNWIVYNPSQFNQNELELILQHEKVHAKQMHSMDVLFMDLITALFWFNPFIWLYSKALKQNLEFIADRDTQKQTNCEERYQKLLLKTSLPQQNLTLINTFYNSTIRLKISGKQIMLFNSFGQVKKRIVMLHKSKSNLMSSWKYTIIVPLLVIFAITFNTEIIAKTTDQVSETLFADQQNMLKFVVTKDSKDNELNLIENKLAERGVTIIFINVKRNSKNEITTIKIKNEFQGQKVHYRKLSEPIRPIEITLTPSTNAINMKQKSSTSDQSSDDELTVEDFKPTSVQVTSGKTKLINNGVIKALIIADGKEITKEEMENIDPNSIQSISVLKDENTIKKYGEKGKDGVIVMTLKKEKAEKNDINSVLYIIDGKEMTKDQMEAINPNTIESIDVLKDESATKNMEKKVKME